MRKFLRVLKDNASEGISKALGDAELLRAVQSELRHEMSNDLFKGRPTGSLGHFVVERDSPQAKDVVLRGKYGAEDIALSALLGPLCNYEEGCLFPGPVMMKVCVAKPGSSAVLQFDCRVSGENESNFSIQKALYHEDFNHLSSSKYRGPQYNSLDPELQKGFRRFLWVRGVDTQLSNFLLVHLHKKEQSQYVKWLQHLESMIARNLER
ncbi:Uncharacterized protein EJ110_NYTH15940 [Nymphaea thermarum]|nr:Uncharacterized protein EJ110_NYTH15940 [Nymphaea thermarum]